MLWTLALLAATVTVPDEDPATRRAREEIEAQLAQMDQAPAPRLDIRFEGATPERYEAVESTFALDEQPLKAEGGVLRTGEVTPGEHVLTGSVLVKDKNAGRILAYAAEYRLRVPFRVTLMAQRGLGLEVSLRVRGEDTLIDQNRRLRAEVKVDAVMLGPASDEQTDPEPESGAGADAGPAALDGGKAYTKMKTGNWKVKKAKKPKTAKPFTKMKTGEWASADAPTRDEPKKAAPKKGTPKKPVTRKPAKAPAGH